MQSCDCHKCYDSVTEPLSCMGATFVHSSITGMLLTEFYCIMFHCLHTILLYDSIEKFSVEGIPISPVKKLYETEPAIELEKRYAHKLM